MVKETTSSCCFEDTVEEEEALRNVVVVSDRKRITQVLLNLISNALKFTFKGYIRVAVRMIDEQTLEFEVSDSGVGISEEGQKNLFKLFGKLRESQQVNQTGCGLGLTICEKIVNKLGG